jgi:hypothetical protein
VGRFSRRPDLAILVIAFTFGALLNAFAMASPVHAVHAWLGALLGTDAEIPVMGSLFALVLIVEPVLMLGTAAWITRRWTGTSEGVVPLATRFAYTLVPLGLGVWTAHYGFHFLTGAWTFVPVTQAALQELGLPWFGTPMWRLGGMPPALVMPIETGLVALGLVGSLLVAWRIAEREFPRRTRSAFLPWATLAIVLWAAATWLMAQPMEMRGTVMGG